MKIVEGNLIDNALAGKYQIVAQGCNCFHKMKSGIAKSFVETWPSLVAADNATTYGNINKLGTFSTITVDNYIVANIYSQYTYGKRSNGEVFVHWESVYIALRDLYYKKYNHQDKRLIGIPAIGCGLAGGRIEDLETTVNVLEEELKTELFELVIYKG